MYHKIKELNKNIDLSKCKVFNLSDYYDEKSAYKYSLNRDYCFLWKQFSERIDIFLSKKDLDRKLKYMNITAKNYNDIFS